MKCALLKSPRRLGTNTRASCSNQSSTKFLRPPWYLNLQRQLTTSPRKPLNHACHSKHPLCLCTATFSIWPFNRSKFIHMSLEILSLMISTLNFVQTAILLKHPQRESYGSTCHVCHKHLMCGNLVCSVKLVLTSRG